MIWEKVFKSWLSKFCGGQPFKKFEGIWSAEAYHHIPSNFLKAVFHKIYLVHSWILCPIQSSTLPWVWRSRESSHKSFFEVGYCSLNYFLHLQYFPKKVFHTKRVHEKTAEQMLCMKDYTCKIHNRFYIQYFCYEICTYTLKIWRVQYQVK